ncbi:DUF4214 domain-containing protein [Rugamonas aquatica]|uniref:DUF4214 domain-containing protein n=1 Tax=Rugamonas aquatica TaxID=2743357 RepID=A0A6A7N2N6_9BURK|nr:DUF4214 domain-containing protein [Rugamonas aquatica]MQA39266.1 DUF4214 domain-containing protein [Rugamonas aquatica]
MTDDYRSDTSTTGLLTAGGSVTGNFETISDQDWFKISLQAGTTYLFKMTGAPDGGGTMYGYSHALLELVNQAGSTQIMQDVGLYGRAPLKQYTATVSGTYYLQASAPLVVGSYTLSATLPAADDYPAGITTNGVLGVGAPVHGAFEQANDVDWFKFHAEAGQHYKIAAKRDGDPGLAKVTVYDTSGNKVADNVHAEAFEPASGGDYYLALRASGVGAYTATVQVLTDDYSANDSAPGQLTAGSSASGVLQYSRDIDRFKLDMVEGQFYTIGLKKSTAPVFNNFMSLDLLGPAPAGGASATYAHADSSGTPLSITVKAAATGTYWVDVTGSLDNSPDPGAYTLTASASPDDYADNRDSATALAVGGVMSGTLQSGSDTDVVKLTLTAGITYAFAMPQNQAADVRVLFYGPDGSVIHDSKDSDASFGYTPVSSGAYYLWVGGRYDRGIYTPTDTRYTITTAQVGNDVSANADTTARLAADGSYHGTLSQSGGDRDWVELDMTAGTTYVINLDGQHYTKLSIKDATGKQLALSTPQTDGLPAKTLYYTPTASGSYYIEVAASYADAGQPYQLRMSSFVDDYGNDTAHAGKLAYGATVNGALEIANDVDVFKITLNADEAFSIAFNSPQLSGGSTQRANGPMLQIVDSAGKALLPFGGAEARQDSLQRFMSLGSGDYYVKVVNAGAAAAPASYTLTPTLEYPGDDIGSGLDYANTLAIGQLVASAIDRRFDVDTFKVHVNGSGVLSVDLGAAAGTVKLTVIDNKGSSVQPSQSTDYGSHTVISYAARAAGDYHLILTTPWEKPVPADYSLLATFASDDITAPLMKGASIANGATGVALHAKLTLTFNEAVAVGTGLALIDDHGVAVTAPGGAALFSASGNTLQLNPQVLLHPGTTYTLALPQGSVLDMVGNRYVEHACYNYHFTTVKPTETGSSGNDLLAGNATGKHIDGGAGIDTVYYDDSNGPLDITLKQGQATVSLHGADTGDTLTGVERLLFPDHALALDINGHGGQAYRLYQAAFNRAPDLDGLGYWIKTLDDGYSLDKVAGNFLISKEFKQQYGENLNDHDFLTNLYSNILHRAPDPDGFAYWMNTLHNGFDRAIVLSGFSESAENQAALLPLIGQGFPYTVTA